MRCNISTTFILWTFIKYPVQNIEVLYYAYDISIGTRYLEKKCWKNISIH